VTLLAARLIVEGEYLLIAHNRFLLLLTAGLSLTLPLFHMAEPGVASRAIGFKIIYIVVFALIMFSVIAVSQILIQIPLLFLNKNRGDLGEHTFEIREEGLHEITNDSDSLHRWSGVHRMGTTGRFIFIFVAGNIVLYVPMRCFVSVSQANDFIAEIRKRMAGG
jgi:hypothetical protein